MWAILSDIHGNLEALDAVLEDVSRHDVEQVICLGDTVGYGPDSLECISKSRAWPVVLQGHFEQAVLSDDDLTGWSALSAKKSVLKVRDQLGASDLRNFLSGQPLRHEVDNVQFVHGSPRNPLHEYVFPEDIYNHRKMDRIFGLVNRVCFQGHTHVPGIFLENLADESYRFHSPQEIDDRHVLDSVKTICNVGSVGQPRDGNWRACYVLFDGKAIRFRRVEYDIETTIRKIRDNGGDDFDGSRLRDAR